MSDEKLVVNSFDELNAWISEENAKMARTSCATWAGDMTPDSAKPLVAYVVVKDLSKEIDELKFKLKKQETIKKGAHDLLEALNDELKTWYDDYYGPDREVEGLIRIIQRRLT